MSKVFLALSFALTAIVGLSGCGSMSREETVGTVGGAAVGGAVGSAATGGSTIGTVGGAAGGAILGHELGKEYEERNR